MNYRAIQLAILVLLILLFCSDGPLVRSGDGAGCFVGRTC